MSTRPDNAAAASPYQGPQSLVARAYAAMAVSSSSAGARTANSGSGATPDSREMTALSDEKPGG